MPIIFQPQALGNAIIAFAKNADNLTALEGAVASMTEKHVSLNVQPEHYDIVGECIIEAIKIVLKDSATKAQCSKILKKCCTIFLYRAINQNL